MAFPDDFPPEGLDPVFKLLIYYGILYILTTAITAWLITRRRVNGASVQPPRSRSREPQQVGSPAGALNFDDTADLVSSLKVQIQGAEASLEKLNQLKAAGEISEPAYQRVYQNFNSQIEEIKLQLDETLQSDIESHDGVVSEGISREDMDQIEADLEQQLLDLDKDDPFLKPKPEEADMLPPTPQPVSKPVAPPPTTPTPTAMTPKPASPPPQAKPPTAPPVAPPTTPPATSPASTTPTPTPPPSKKTLPPPPPSTMATPPVPDAPQAPITAAQPIKVESDNADDSMFAKSTSIAALRMDMLRELARLKKLIPEDQDQD